MTSSKDLLILLQRLLSLFFSIKPRNTPMNANKTKETSNKIRFVITINLRLNRSLLDITENWQAKKSILS